MPVSSPSYFPTARANDVVVGANSGLGISNLARAFLAGKNAGQYVQGVNDLIILGDNSFAAGTVVAPITDQNFGSSIFIGTNAGTALTAHSTLPGDLYGPIVIGHYALSTATSVGPVVIIGTNAYKRFVGGNTNNTMLVRTVAIGEGVAENLNFNLGADDQHSDNVLIGNQCAQGFSSNGTLLGITESVVIGSQAAGTSGNTVNGSDIQQCVVIGFRAGYNMSQGTHSTNGVIIGSDACSNPGVNATNFVAVGANSQASVGISQTVTVGTQANCAQTEAVAVGYSAGANNHAVALGSRTQTNRDNGIAIGYGAGTSGPTVTPALFWLENVNLAGGGAMFFGDLSAGNLVIGNSVNNTNRDFGGANAKNIVKLLNGNPGSANPIGGGYFYVTAGALHWVGSSGTDTQLAPA